MKHFLYSTSYEVKQAYLNLKQKPLFVFSVVSTMGITLGALLCVLTLAYVMLIKPLPYPEQDKLYIVEQSQIDNSQKENVKGFSYPALLDFYKHQQIFSQAALVDYGESALASHPKSPTINQTFITPEWFSLLATKAIKGRLFEQTEKLNSYHPVAVISYDLWRNYFDKSDEVIGKSIFTHNQYYTIIGVVEPTFIEPSIKNTDYKTDVWLPWDYNPTRENIRKRWWGRTASRTIIGKLLPQASPQQAEQQSSQYLDNIWQEKITGENFYNGWHVKAQLTSFYKKIIGDAQITIFLLIISTISLLLIASLNIANLWYARFNEREHTFSLYAALGAKKRNLLQTIVIENLILFTLALTIAIGFSTLLFSLLQQNLALYLPRVDELELQNVTLIAGILISALLIFIFSLMLTNTINYKNLVSKLINSGKGTTAQISTKKQQRLILSQIIIVLTLVFLTISVGWKSLQMITFKDGMDANDLQSLQIRMQANSLPSRDEMHALVEQLRNELTQRPEVITVSRSLSPLTYNSNTWSLTEISSLKQFLPQGRSIDHQYFSLTGQKLVQGRMFSKADIKNKDNILIINDVLAKKITANGDDVVGKRLSFDISGGDKYAFTIVGVVSGFKIAGQDTIPPRVYRPANDLFSLMIHTKAHQQLDKNSVKKTLNKVSSIFKIYRLESIQTQKNKKLFSSYIIATVSISLIILTITLAAIGLYGILSYSTQMRRLEIGTRMAIGAKRSDLIRLIIKDNSKAILFGIGISILALIALSLSFSEQLAQYLTWQLIPLFLVTIGLVSLISFTACYLPLRQYINKPAMYSLKGSE